MARIIHSINTTPGGSCHHTDVVADEAHHAYALDLLQSASGVLLGRNTFDLFASFWPQAVHRSDLPEHMLRFATELNEKAKFILTGRSLQTDWPNTTVLAGPDLTAVRSLLHGLPGTVVVFGSPGLGASLAEAGLVNELQLLVQPMLAPGATTRAFAALQTGRRLALLEARPFASGVTLLRYSLQDAAGA